MKGAWGKILRVDLTQETTSVVEPEEEIYKTYLGGQALGAYYMFKEGIVGPEVKADDPRNLLQFYVGPVTGVGPGGRSTAVTKSPYSLLCTAMCGGNTASELKCAGWDGIQIVGKASDPVYLAVMDDNVEIRDASYLWGVGAEHTDADLRKRVFGPYDYSEESMLYTEEMPPLLAAKHPEDPDKGIGAKRLARSWVIGPGGENKVWYAGIMTEGARAHARYGPGYVMGSKNLKAVTIVGGKGHPLADKTTFSNISKTIQDTMKKSFSWRTYGTTTGWRNSMVTSCYPIRNWQEGSWEDPEAVTGFTGAFMKNASYVKNQSCVGCVQKCLTTTRITSENPRIDGTVTDMPDWEAMGNLGGNLGFMLPEGTDWTPADPYPLDHWGSMDALHKLQRATYLHDDLGIDFIEGGMNLALIMELRQRNLITAADLDGIDLKWGDIDAVEDLLKKIAHREGVGDKLANGTYETAKYFAALKNNPDIMKYHMTAHRYGQPAHTVRGGCKSALSYISTVKPCSHMDGNAEGAALVGQQDTSYARNSVVICSFVAGPWGVEGMTSMIKAATGWNDWTYDMYLAVGTRAHALGRIFEMYTQMDDPEFSPTAWDHQAAWKWFNEPFTTGPWPKGTSIRWEDGLTVDEAKLYNEKFPAYYWARGYTTDTGIPTEETLEELGLRDLAGSYATELLNRYGGGVVAPTPTPTPAPGAPAATPAPPPAEEEGSGEE